MWRTANISATNCMTLVIQNLQSDMINVGWVNVAAGNIASNGTIQIRWDVFKSPGTNNSIGNDWFMLMGTDTATNTQLFVTVAGGYNTSTNAVSNFIPIVTSGPVAANGFCSFGANTCNTGNVFTLGTSAMPTAGLGMRSWSSVTIDRVIICVAQTAFTANGSTFYCGMYDSFMPLSIDPYPIICSNIAAYLSAGPANITVAGAGGSISEPSNNATIVGNFCIATTYNWTVMTAQDTYLGATGASNYGVGTYQGRFPISRTIVAGRGNNTGVVGIRGLLKDVIITTLNTPTYFSAALGSNRGDNLSFSFNNNNYTYFYLGDELTHSVAGASIVNGTQTGTYTWVLQV